MAWTAAILTTAATDYLPIRTFLGASSTDLPDATIEQDPFLPTAEAIVKQALTTYAAIVLAGGDNLALLKAGVQALTAALLCQGVDRGDLSAFRVGEYEETVGRVDWRAKALDLMKAAFRTLGAISTRTFIRRTLVAVAGPTRSGTNIPDELEQWVERIVPRFVDWVEEGGEDDSWAQP